MFTISEVVNRLNNDKFIEEHMCTVTEVVNRLISDIGINFL